MRPILAEDATTPNSYDFGQATERPLSGTFNDSHLLIDFAPQLRATSVRQTASSDARSAIELPSNRLPNNINVARGGFFCSHGAMRDDAAKPSVPIELDFLFTADDAVNPRFVPEHRDVRLDSYSQADPPSFEKLFEGRDVNSFFDVPLAKSADPSATVDLEKRASARGMMRLEAVPIENNETLIRGYDHNGVCCFETIR